MRTYIELKQTVNPFRSTLS